MKKFTCPNCGSEEFVTEPNQYDVLIFNKNGFEVESTEQIDGTKTYCRECSEEVDEEQSVKQKKIVLMPPKISNINENH